MREEKKLIEMFQSEKVNAPDYDKMWDNIQSSKYKKKRSFINLLIPAASVVAAILLFSPLTNAEKIFEKFEWFEGGSKVVVENMDNKVPDVEAPEDVSNHHVYFDREEAKDILPILPVAPSYLPEGYSLSVEEGIIEIPNYNEDGQLLSVTKDNPHYTFYYQKGEDPNDKNTFTVSYRFKKIRQLDGLVTKYDRFNPEPITLLGLEGVLYQNGIFIHKNLDDYNLTIEIMVSPTMSDDDKLKMMESIIEELK